MLFQDNIALGTRALINRRETQVEWLRRLTRKPKVRTVVGSNPALDSLVAVRNSSLGRPERCEGNLVAVAGSCVRLTDGETSVAPAGNKSLRLSHSHV